MTVGEVGEGAHFSPILGLPGKEIWTKRYFVVAAADDEV